MRSVGLMAILLLFVACKPVTRGPDSDLEAVTDGNLTLGVVAVESNDTGAQAYRLLVCRQSSSFPKWMLEDNNRCRPALLDSQGSEVVFIHDELERDFATKYAGYGKAFVVPVLVGVAAWSLVFGPKATGAIPVGGEQGGLVKWANTKNWVQRPSNWVGTQWKKVTSWSIFNNKLVNWITRKPAQGAALFQKGVARVVPPNWVLATNARLRLLTHLDQGGKYAQDTFRVGVNLQDAITEQTRIAKLAHDLYGMKEMERLFKAMDNVEVGKQTEHIDNLKKELEKLLGSKEVDGKMVTYKDTMAQIAKNQEKGEDSLEYIEGLAKLKKIEAYEKAIGDAGFNQVDGKYDFSFLKKEDNILKTLTSEADKLDDAPDGSIQAAAKAVYDAKATRKYTQFGVSYEGFKNLAIKGAAGIALITMTDLDKSVFGYAERQTSQHWSQVFSEGMTSQNQVKDLPTLLRGFADFFGHNVNPQALALSN